MYVYRVHVHSENRAVDVLPDSIDGRELEVAPVPTLQNRPELTRKLVLVIRRQMRDLTRRLMLIHAWTD
jgi:hypothetical protein